MFTKKGLEAYGISSQECIKYPSHIVYIHFTSFSENHQTYMKFRIIQNVTTISKDT